MDPWGERLVKICVDAFIPRREDLPDQASIFGPNKKPGVTENGVDWFDEPLGSRVPIKWAISPMYITSAVWETGYWQFAGDRRTFGEKGTSRLSATFYIETDSIRISRDKTERQVPIECTLGEDRSRRRFVTLVGKFETTYSPDNKPRGYIERFDCGDTAKVTMNFSRGYPYTPRLVTPDIDIILTCRFERKPSGELTVAFQGLHNKFPCYEILIDDVCKYKWSPKDSEPSISNLGRDWEVVSEEPLTLEYK